MPYTSICLAILLAAASVQSADEKCTHGSFKCDEKGYVNTCLGNGRWLAQWCGPGMTCKEKRDGGVVCGLGESKPKPNTPAPTPELPEIPTTTEAPQIVVTTPEINAGGDHGGEADCNFQPAMGIRCIGGPNSSEPIRFECAKGDAVCYALKCRDACNEDPRCAKYTVHVGGGGCHKLLDAAECGTRYGKEQDGTKWGRPPSWTKVVGALCNSNPSRCRRRCPHS